MLPALVSCVTHDLMKFKLLTSFVAESNFCRNINEVCLNCQGLVLGHSPVVEKLWFRGSFICIVFNYV